MSDNPLTKAVSRPKTPQQTPQQEPKKTGKIDKQSKTKIEYRAPMSELGEEYLGACDHAFTKAQYEKLVRSPKMPPSFLSVRASEPKGDKVCLYASKVFGETAVRGLIGKLKRSCTEVAGSGSEAACKELIGDLKSRLPKPQKEQKTPSLEDPRSLNPFSIKFWKDRWRGSWGGADFAIGMGFIAGVAWAVKTLIVWAVKKFFSGRGGDGTGGSATGGTDKKEGSPKSSNSKKGSLAIMAALEPDSFGVFTARVVQVLGHKAGHEFIAQRGYDFESLNLLPEDAFAQTVREYAMWDGIIDAPISKAPAVAKAPTVAANVPMNTAARDLIASGAAYLGQAHVQASIKKFRLEHVGEKYALLRGHDGKLWTLPKLELPASARIRSIISINPAALRPAPIQVRVRARVGFRP